MKCRKSITVWAIPLLLLVAPTWAHAADIEAQERAAKKACLLGEVDKGAEILADLYVATNNPTYIYNQGRCYEQNGNNERAVLRFKEYLRKARDLSREDADAIRKKISELESGMPSAPKAEPAAPPSQSALASTAPLPPAAAPSPSPPEHGDALGLHERGTSTEPPASVPVYKRWWFWTGVTAVVAGGVVAGILLTKKSAPTSPACDGLGTCVP